MQLCMPGTFLIAEWSYLFTLPSILCENDIHPVTVFWWFVWKDCNKLKVAGNISYLLFPTKPILNVTFLKLRLRTSGGVSSKSHWIASRNAEYQWHLDLLWVKLKDGESIGLSKFQNVFKIIFNLRFRWM